MRRRRHHRHGRRAAARRGFRTRMRRRAPWLRRGAAKFYVFR